ncbi:MULTISPECIES: hypothetical protein [unclassified Arcicella]|uniref:hypothetical protein n=1 Tax=unclassified Arcicella TaxID=2644986 RepID=UPI0028592060|nr:MULTISPECIES: hypothetical protein [unclassified Arcicella]MDR6564944.1 hypothetical protein [Arcicella sp. BE51]MDR6814734.1 hypothetical protein [Arcicella sp. BE140]MDR6826180.1 hypothetical protein [Arcicella sp. BE139]
MKILAIVEIDEFGTIISEKPEAKFMENAEIKTVEAFFKNTEKLHEEYRTLSTIKKNNMVRLNANFNEISKMGFVHTSELDKYLEKKLVELENRVKINIYWKRLVANPFRKMLFSVGGKFGAMALKFGLKSVKS